jgi:hypothetical protein
MSLSDLQSLAESIPAADPFVRLSGFTTALRIWSADGSHQLPIANPLTLAGLLSSPQR